MRLNFQVINDDDKDDGTILDAVDDTLRKITVIFKGGILLENVH